MTKLQLEKDIKKLKLLLILYTLIQSTILYIIFFKPKIQFQLDQSYKLNWIIWVLNIVVIGYFIWYNWKKLPIPKNEKINNTLMIVFLGVIGMWIWLPNKAEIEKITK